MATKSTERDDNEADTVSIEISSFLSEYNWRGVRYRLQVK